MFDERLTCTSSNLACQAGNSAENTRKDNQKAMQLPTRPVPGLALLRKLLISILSEETNRHLDENRLLSKSIKDAKEDQGPLKTNYSLTKPSLRPVREEKTAWPWAGSTTRKRLTRFHIRGS